jgi:hypothetical protein
MENVLDTIAIVCGVLYLAIVLGSINHKLDIIRATLLRIETQRNTQ